MPRVNVTRPSMPPMEEYFAEVAPLWESRWLTNAGEKHRELEAALGERLDVGDVCLFANGHSALECAIEALELGSDGRDEVITTPFTFVSTANAIMRKGLRPVFADVRASDLTLDPELVERAVTPRTCAILPVHVYGNLCDADAIQKIADRHGLKVVYDAAHAFGVERWDSATGKWRGAASFGDASMLSFHATKVFNTVEGGAVCFSDPTLRGRLEAWRGFGIGAGGEESLVCGGNAKMDEFRAAMGLCNLRHVDREIDKRATVEERYREGLDGVRGLRLVGPRPDVRSNHAYLPVFFEDGFGTSRDEVRDVLAAEGFGARRYFFPLASGKPCHAGRFDPTATPVALDASRRVLCLPMYADLALEDVDAICRVVRGCAR